MSESQLAAGLSTAPALTGTPASFENECIDLLCRQENTLTQLAEASRRHRTLDALELTRKMLLQFLDFAETHFPEQQLNSVGHRLYEVNQLTRQYEKMLDAQSCRLLKRWIGITVPDKEELDKTHEQLRRDYVDLYNAFFSDCARQFSKDSTAVREEFLKSVATFLKELERIW